MAFESMTNEEMVKKFSSQFDLVNYAIKVAEWQIRSGTDSLENSAGDGNRALLVLRAIMAGKERIGELNIDGKMAPEATPPLAKEPPAHDKKPRTVSGDEPVKPAHSKTRASRKQVEGV